MVPEPMAHSDPSSSTGVQPQRHAPPPPPVVVPEPVQLPNNNLQALQIRLDRTNYPFWRALVLAATRAYGLEGYLLGSIPPPPMHLPPGNIDNPSFLQWQRFDQFLFHWLFNSITESMLGHVLNCNSAAEIWSVLHRIFSAKSKARILQVQSLLQSTKKGSDSIDEYVLKMKGYADSLSAAGEQISEERL